jgi:hypothetical protein
VSEDKSDALEGQYNPGMYDSIFLRNLEKWIDQIISRDGVSDKQHIVRIRDKFELAMRANIRYHTEMSEGGNVALSEYHKLVAKVYESLLPAGSKLA